MASLTSFSAWAKLNSFKIIPALLPVTWADLVSHSRWRVFRSLTVGFLISLYNLHLQVQVLASLRIRGRLNACCVMSAMYGVSDSIAPPPRLGFAYSSAITQIDWVPVLSGQDFKPTACSSLHAYQGCFLMTPVLPSIAVDCHYQNATGTNVNCRKTWYRVWTQLLPGHVHSIIHPELQDRSEATEFFEWAWRFPSSA